MASGYFRFGGGTEMSTNIPFTVYDETTGKIKRTGACAANSLLFQAGPGESVIAAPSNPLTQRVRLFDDEIIEKALLTIQLDRTEYVIDTNTPITMTGLPGSIEVFVDGIPTMVLGDTFEVRFDTPGPHVIWIDELNYQHASWEVTAV